MTNWTTVPAPGQGTNLITNGTFDSGISGWTGGGSWDSSLQALKVSGTTGIYTTYNFINGAQYQLTFTILQGDTDHHGALDIVQGDTSSTNLIVELLQDNMTFHAPYTYTFTANTGMSNPTRLTFVCTDGDHFWIDTVALYALPLPVGTSFTTINAHGNETYDEQSETYDQSTDFYDALIPNYWTSIVGSSNTQWTSIATAV